MEKFNSIIANIEKELLELKKINEALREENSFLREQLAMPNKIDNNEEISLEEVFNSFYLKDDSKGLREKTFHSLLQTGKFKVVSDFIGKSIYDLIEIRNARYATWAITIIVIEHYGVRIEVPDLETISESKERNVIQKVIDAVIKYRERIEFKE